jgi:hypothetical protein
LISFSRALEVFEHWLDRQIKTAIDEELLPDLWATAVEQLAGSGDSRAVELDFTPEEREQLKLALSTFRLRLIEEFHPTAEQLDAINEKLDYLKAAVDRLNKFDWKGVALSTLIGISTNLSLDTERGRQLYGLFQQALSAIQHLLR